MIQTLLRGRTLSFRRYPETADDLDAFDYNEDGAVLVEAGRIVASVARQAAENL